VRVTGTETFFEGRAGAGAVEPNRTDKPNLGCIDRTASKQSNGIYKGFTEPL